MRARSSRSTRWSEGRGYGSRLLDGRRARRPRGRLLAPLVDHDERQRPSDRLLPRPRVRGRGGPRRSDRRVAEAQAFHPSRQRARRADTGRDRDGSAGCRPTRTVTSPRKEDREDGAARQSPDPIDDPKGYQDHLLGLLGDDDPAAVQARTPATLRQLAAEAGPDLFLRPEPTEWSAFECMAHITDAEIVMSGRYRWVLAHDEPPLIGYDQDLWVDRLHVDETASTACWTCSTRSVWRTSRCGAHARRAAPAGGHARRTRTGELRPRVPHDRRPRPVPRGAGGPRARSAARSVAVRERLTPTGRRGSPPAAPPLPACRAARCRCRTSATGRTTGTRASTGTA